MGRAGPTSVSVTAAGRLVVSARAVLAVVAGTVLVAGCGGSLADADRPRTAPVSRPPAGDFCAAVLAGAEAARPLANLLAQSTDDRQQIDEAVNEVRRTNADVLATAPAEIRTDVERAVAASDLQLDLLEAAGGDAGAVARDAGVRRRLATQEYAVATRRVRDYVVANCGVDARRLDP